MDKTTKRARDFYAVYCASSGGKNYRGDECPTWDDLPLAIQCHWCVVAARACQLEREANGTDRARSLGAEGTPPDTTVIGHMSSFEDACATWRAYSADKLFVEPTPAAEPEPTPEPEQTDEEEVFDEPDASPEEKGEMKDHPLAPEKTED